MVEHYQQALDKAEENVRRILAKAEENDARIEAARGARPEEAEGPVSNDPQSSPDLGPLPAVEKIEAKPVGSSPLLTTTEPSQSDGLRSDIDRSLDQARQSLKRANDQLDEIIELESRIAKVGGGNEADRETTHRLASEIQGLTTQQHIRIIHLKGILFELKQERRKSRPAEDTDAATPPTAGASEAKTPVGVVAVEANQPAEDQAPGSEDQEMGGPGESGRSAGSAADFGSGGISSGGRGGSSGISSGGGEMAGSGGPIGTKFDSRFWGASDHKEGRVPTVISKELIASPPGLASGGTIWAFGASTGEWRRFELPQGIRAETVLSQDLLALKLTSVPVGDDPDLDPAGVSVGAIAVFDPGCGEWQVQELVEPTDQAVPMVGAGLVTYKVGRRVYAYAAEARRWDVLDLGPEPGPSVPNFYSNWATIESRGKLHTFSTRTGHWSTLDPEAGK